jgi:serine/threonine protein kinase/WD40 repeat protein
MGPTPQGAAWLDRLSEEFLDRFRRGERPSAAEFAGRHPEFAEVIRDRLTTLAARELMAKHAPCSAASPGGPLALAAPPGYRILRQVGHGGMGIVFDAVRLGTGERVALKVLPFHRDACQVERFLQEARAARTIDHPNIIPVSDVGEEVGGFSYYAMRFVEGRGLNEVIQALRNPLRAGLCSRAAPGIAGRSIGLDAALSPSGIAHARPGRAEAGGEPPCAPTPEELARQLRRGDLLPREVRDRAESQAGTPYYHAVAALIRQAADAIARAHEHRILHRDIKPSNLLLERTGHLWVADFGLAKLEEGKDLTRTGDLLGTYRYMAPERFGHQSDPRGDIYSLGITLHELLTLRPAFEEADCPRLIERVRHEEPPRPRQLDYRIPRDLETIVLSATAKSPADRYATAAKFRDDLDRFLGQEPIAARPLPTYRRAWRWSQRRPLDAALIAALATVLVVGVVLLFRKWREAVDVNLALADQIQVARSTSHQLRRSVNQLGATERLLRLERRMVQIRQAYADIQGQKAPSAMSLLDDLARTGSGADTAPAPRDFLFCLVDNMAHAESERRPAHAETALAVAFDPSGHRLACGGECRPAAGGPAPGALTVWEGDRPAWKLDPLPEAVIAVAFRPGGRDVAALTADLARPESTATLRVWELSTRRERWKAAAGSTPAANAGIASLEYTPDGVALAAIGDDGGIMYLDADDGRPRPDRRPPAVWAHSFALGPGGRQIALGTEGEEGLLLADAATGDVLWRAGTLEKVADLEFHPDGGLLAVATTEGTVELRRARDGSLVRTLLEPSRKVRRIGFRGDGQVLATAGGDGAARLWSVPRLHPIAAYSGHGHQLRSVAFHPAGRFLATVGDGEGIKLWDATSSPGPRVLPTGGSGRRLSLAFSPDSATVVTSRVDRPLERWDTRTATRIGAVPIPCAADSLANDPVRPVAVAPAVGVALMVPACQPEVARLLELETGRVRDVLSGGSEPIRVVGLSADGLLAVTACWPGSRGGPGSLCLWGDGGWDRPPRGMDAPPGRIHALAFDPSAERIAGAVSVEEGGSLRTRLCLWSRDSGRIVWSWEGPPDDYAWDLAWSSDGRWVAACGGGRILVVEAALGLVRSDIPTAQHVRGLAFHPKEPLLAAVSRRGVLLHHLELRQDVLELELPEAAPRDSAALMHVAFSPDGAQLAATLGSGNIAIWDARPRGDGADRRDEDERWVALWHWRQFRQATRSGDEFAAGFHRDRLRGTWPVPLQRLVDDRAMKLGTMFPMEGD